MRSASAQPEVEPSWGLEAQLWQQGCLRVAGVDEAGRGALAGPVVAAVVVLEPGRVYPYRDSKTLAPRTRAELAERVRVEASAWSVGAADPCEVDELNVLGATHLAVRRALAALSGGFDGLVTDYLKLALQAPEVAVPRADSLSFQVAAASIIAKVERDRLMVALDAELPGYGFAKHKGYCVSEHVAALARLGPSRHHRRTFAPVRGV